MKTVEEIKKRIEELEIRCEDYERYGDDEGLYSIYGQIDALKWVLEESK